VRARSPRRTEVELVLAAFGGHAVENFAPPHRRMAAPNCSSTRMAAFPSALAAMAVSNPS
jgi:hypothetical protein